MGNLKSGTIYVEAGEDYKLKYVPTDIGTFTCEVAHGEDRDKVVAVVDLHDLQPLEPMPADFEAYWANIRNQLDEVPIDEQITLDTSFHSPFSTTYQIQLGNIDGRKAYGYMSVPNKSGAFTGIIQFPAFGNSSATSANPGLAERVGAIVVSINIHNAPPDVNLPDNELYNPDIATTDTVFYRWAISAGMRIIDYLETRSDFDGEHIAAVGVSQGAGLAFLLSGIDERVDLFISSSPILSQHNGLAFDKPSGFPVYIKNNLNQPNEIARILNAVKYYDLVNAAQNFKGNALIHVAWMDEVTSAEATFTAINQLEGKTVIFNNLYGKHKNTAVDFWDAQFSFIRRYFPINNSWPWPSFTTSREADAGLDITASCLFTDISGTIRFNGSTNPTNIPVHWEVVSGTGSVTFDNANTYSTSVQFSEPGEYKLRFVGEDSSMLPSDSVYASFHDVVTLDICPNHDCLTPKFTTAALDKEVSCEALEETLSEWIEDHGEATLSNDANVSWTNNFNALNQICDTTFQVQFVATNVCGPSDTTTASFHTYDIDPPSFLTEASNKIVQCDGNGNQQDLNQWLAQNAGATATDCHTITWSNNFVLLGSNCNPDATVTFTATDECGNINNTTATFKIKDTTPPTLNSIAFDRTVECDGEGNMEALNLWLAQNGGASASDICSQVSWSNDFTQLTEGCSPSATVIFIVTDECGLKNTTTATFKIQDTTPPTISTPAMDQVVECTGSGNVEELNQWLAQNGGATAEDNCHSIVWTNDFTQVNADCNPSATVTFTVTDECGNSNTTTATFKITDTTPPEILTQATNLSVPTNNNGNQEELNQWLAQNGGATATEECNTFTWANNFTNITEGCSPSATVTFSATDECGNTSQSIATFTIIKTIPPSISSPSVDMMVACDGTGNQNELNQWLGQHGGATTSNNIAWSNNFSGLSEGCIREAKVVFRITDDCGLMDSTEAVFKIIDTFPPIILSPAMDKTINCDGSNYQNILDTWLAQNANASTMDLCSGITWSNDFTELKEGCNPATLVTFMATDLCGLKDSTSATFTLIDTSNITSLSPASNLTVPCGDDNLISLNEWIDNQAGSIVNNTCQEITWSNDFSGLPNTCNPSSKVTFIASGSCGFQDTISATFTILDSVKVAFENIAKDTTVECNGNGNLADLNQWLLKHGGVTTPSCQNISWKNKSYDFIGDDCSSSALVTFVATNICGFEDSIQATFNIIDNTPPTFSQAPDTLFLICNNSEEYPKLQTWLDENGGAIATDVCGDVTWTSTLSEILCQDSMKQVEFLAIDDCNNSSSITGVIKMLKAVAIFDIDEDSAIFNFISATPNPFRDKTILLFELGQSTSLTLSFYNNLGIPIQTIEQRFTAGPNQFTVPASLIQQTGLFYYKIEGPRILHIGKLILQN